MNDFNLLAEKLKELNITNIAEVNEEAKEKILADKSISFHKKALDDMLNGLALSKPEYSGEVWVMAEHAENNIKVTKKASEKPEAFFR